MAAIITEQFRKNSRRLLMNDISSNNYFIGIGQQQNWDEARGSNISSPYPAGTAGDETRVLEQLTGLFGVNASNIDLVIPKNTIEANNSYKVYDPYDPTCFYEDRLTQLKPCYIITRSGVGTGDHIFLCISKYAGSGPAGALAANSLGSTGADTYGTYIFDNHVWAYLGQYDKFNEINTAAFVALGPDVSELEADAEKNAKIKNETGGLIFGFHIINGGKNKYRLNANSAPGDPNASGVVDSTISVTGIDASGATKNYDDIPVKISVDGATNSITNISIDHEVLTGDAMLLEWVAAKAQLNLDANNIIDDPNPDCPCDDSAFDAVIMPKIAPISGFGYRQSETLPSWYVGIFVDTSVSTYLPAGTTYHQISLIKDPLDNDGTKLSNTYINPVKYFTRNTTYAKSIPATSAGQKITTGWKIQQFDDTLDKYLDVGVISYIQTTANDNTTELNPYQFYYYNDHVSGYVKMTNDKPLKFISPDGDETKDILTVDFPATVGNIGEISSTTKYKERSGDVMFIDNRGTIIREEGQNEELKLIIQL